MSIPANENGSAAQKSTVTLSQAEFDTLNKRVKDNRDQAMAAQQSTAELKTKKKYYSSIAKNTHLKNKRINIRLSEKIINDLKAKSLEEGIPYQTLISSILHKFTSGKLVEKSN